MVDNPHDSDLENLTAEEWRLCHEVEITLQTMAFWQQILEGEKYVTVSVVPVGIYTIRQSFLQVIASVGSRVVYPIGIFWSVSVSISWYLPYRYRRKIWSVQFSIKKGAIAPFFPKKGVMVPFLRISAPLLKKKGGNDTKRGERYRPKIPIPSQSDTG